jgi:ribosomal protein S28E/S33
MVSTGLVGSVVVGKSQIVEGDFCRRIIYRFVK